VGVTTGGEPAVVRAWRRRLGDRSDPSRAALVVLIAWLTFLITILAALQVDAGARSAIAGRTADSIGASAAGRDAAGVIRTGTDLGVVRRWAETLFEAGWAEEVINPEASGSPQAPGDRPGDVQDRELVMELLRIDRELLAWAQEQSPLFAPPYFDGAGVDTDIARLDAERNVGPRARAAEERGLALAESAAWSRRAGDYLTAITTVAAGLFFLGVAVALKGNARRILAVSGIVAGLAAIGMAAMVALQPVDRVPPAAVDAVVEARMASGMTTWTAGSEVDQRDRRDWAVAIDAAERAVTIAPGYASAYLVRAEVRAQFGDDLLLAIEPSPEEARPLLEGALADYRHYVTLEPGSYAAWWNYGWVAYLVGDNATAQAAAERALVLSPDQFTLYLNRALARLSAGDVAASRADVATALEVASRSRLDSNAWFFAQADYDLGRLATLRPAEADELLAMQRQVRAAAVAQRIGRPVGPADGPALGPVRLVTLALGPDARLAEGRAIEPGATLPVASADGLRISIAGAAIPDGAVVSVRVRANGIEQPAYRVDRPWLPGAPEMTFDLVSPSGRIGTPMDSNDYTVEVFLDAVTKAEIAFLVDEPDGAFGPTATDVIALMLDGGLACADPIPAGGDRNTVTCLTEGTPRDIGTETVTTFDTADRVQSLTVSRTNRAAFVEGELRQFAAAAIGYAVDDLIAPAVREWIAAAALGSSTVIGGIELQFTEAPGDEPRLSFEARIDS
jgi:tetratricopeptide (TPR) repeat protein